VSGILLRLEKELDQAEAAIGGYLASAIRCCSCGLVVMATAGQQFMSVVVDHSEAWSCMQS
jgi:hypothetical protein